MSKFEITEYGSCTTFVTHYIVVEGDTPEEALEQYRATGKCISKESEFDIDDDYSDFESIEEYKET